MIMAAGYVGTVTGLCGRAEDCRDANAPDLQKTTNEQAKSVLEKARDINVMVTSLLTALSGPQDEPEGRQEVKGRRCGVEALLSEAEGELERARRLLDHCLHRLGEPAPVD